jgi:hypothetical protein
MHGRDHEGLLHLRRTRVDPSRERAVLLAHKRLEPPHHTRPDHMHQCHAHWHQVTAMFTPGLIQASEQVLRRGTRPSDAYRQCTPVHDASASRMKTSDMRSSISMRRPQIQRSVWWDEIQNLMGSRGLEVRPE